MISSSIVELNAANLDLVYGGCQCYCAFRSWLGWCSQSGLPGGSCGSACPVYAGDSVSQCQSASAYPAYANSASWIGCYTDSSSCASACSQVTGIYNTMFSGYPTYNQKGGTFELIGTTCA